MASCYPTGCTPCDGEIEFPKNPSDSYYSPKGDIDLTKTVADQNITLVNNDVYTVTLTSLNSRLSGIEADEILDDATSSALLTLIASLTARITALESAN
jgi:hypothetical protein